MATRQSPSHWRPTYRRLRAYAFDPSLATALDTAVLNEATLNVVWESDLEVGPVGEYLEVVDYDPASNRFYEPVDLNHNDLLAQDGLPPSEGTPQFHQQMVYAVAMTTIRHFEQALGRRVLWSPRRFKQEQGKPYRKPDYVPQLRIYPHALREANAYYSPEKKALLFGYFPASLSNPGKNLPGGIVFTCLSHDIVAHETTHALLDGLHRRFVEPSNRDALAFHEAFADIVALFQHFTFPTALRHQISKTRGDLSSQNLLGELARQFGEAIGSRGALRSAINQVDPQTGQPDPTKYEQTTEPHARGAILVAAVFDAFIAIYRARVEDLFRIATGGAGQLPERQLHPDLVNRLSADANKAALHVLRMCVRALDYLPPVDVTFGEYLRAIISADYDLVPDDDRGYRIAMIEAFRRRGIYPRDVRTLSVESLLWQAPKVFFPMSTLPKLNLRWDLNSSREQIYEANLANGKDVWNWLKQEQITKQICDQMGLALTDDAPRTIDRSDVDHLPRVEVHSVRPARRVGPDGQHLTDLIIEITQSRRAYFERDKQARADRGDDGVGEHDFSFRGGCTLVVDLEQNEVRYAIRKSIVSDDRLECQRIFMSPFEGQSLRATYFGAGCSNEVAEPFALLHRS
jgi:hypothetical protein